MRRFGSWASLPGLATRDGEVEYLERHHKFPWLTSESLPETEEWRERRELVLYVFARRAPTREDSR